MIGRCHSGVFYILHHVAVLFVSFTIWLLKIFWSFTLEPLVHQLWNICFMWCLIVRKMVMLKVISLALLCWRSFHWPYYAEGHFIGLIMIRIRFPANMSIVHILRSRYKNTLVKEVGKFEKIYYKLQKCKTDMVFLETCLENNTKNFWTFA